MDDDTYLVLRLTGGTTSGPIWRSIPTSGGVLGGGDAAEYEVDLHQLDAQTYSDLQRDPSIIGLARPMPLQLIAPLDEDAPNTEPPADQDVTWGVQVTGAADSPYTGAGITVAVLDTGIEASHPAFKGIELIEQDFTGEGNGDHSGHGTHVAGIIFGQNEQGPRYSVAPGIRRALIAKVIGKRTQATTHTLVKAVQWASDNGAKIINMSLGFDFPGYVARLVAMDWPVELATSRALTEYRQNLRLLDSLVQLIQANTLIPGGPGALIIAAAGNESKRDSNPKHVIEVAPPAAADGVLAIAALQSAGPPHDTLTVAPFSNIHPALSAPGVDIYSATRGSGFKIMSGTSMAAPHVTGLAALWAERQLKQRGSISITTLAAQLRGSVRPLPGLGAEDVGDGLAVAPSN
jgi:subtilisin family serine protease